MMHYVKKKGQRTRWVTFFWESFDPTIDMDVILTRASYRGTVGNGSWKQFPQSCNLFQQDNTKTNSLGIFASEQEKTH